MRVRFKDFVFDTEARQLERNGVPIRLSPKAFTVLEMLLERRPNAVSKRELLDRVWPDTVVEERNVKNVVAEIRSALDDDSDNPALVRTVQRFGYAFSAEVQVEEPHSAERERGTRPKRRVGLAVAFAVAVVLAGVGVWTLLTRKNSMPSVRPPFQQIRLTRLSTAGNVSAAAISPDGKLFAYSTEDGLGTLWLGQTGSESRRELVSSPDLGFADTDYGGITFSPDGNYIYYTAWLSDQINSLSRIPTIGGAITKVLRDVDSAIAFSPDGTRFAFTRGGPQVKTTVRVANADGSEESAVLTKAGFYEFTHASWSPDGRTIATALNDGQGRYSVECIDIGSGRSAIVGRTQWSHIGTIAWLTDGSGLLLSAREPGEAPVDQVWLLSYPEGVARRITHDLNDYQSLTVNRDSKLLVVQTARAGQLWISSATGASPRQVTANTQTGLNGFSWTEAGEILYTVTSGNSPDIWRINPRDGAAVPVIEHPGFDGTPIECGEFVVFTSSRSGKPGILWRADRDGHNVVQLSTAKTYGWPVCSADGQWVFYGAPEDDRNWNWFRPWKVSIRGTGAQLVSHALAVSAIVLSPDGKRLAFVSRPSSAEMVPLGKAFLAILDIETGSIRKLENPLGSAWNLPLQWTPDGKAVAYGNVRDGIANIWRLPLDGSPPTPITHFDSGQTLMNFAFSHDGKQLALLRGWKTSDVVLIEQ